MKKEVNEFAGKSLRKDFSSKSKTKTVIEEKKIGVEPYKKPKLSFKHYLDEQLEEFEELDY